jgi:hypothetical protein
MKHCSDLLVLIENPLFSKKVYLPKYFHIFSYFISQDKICDHILII